MPDTNDRYRTGAGSAVTDRMQDGKLVVQHNVLSLFSGIGGLDLGLERAGMTVVGLVERDEVCRDVLARHWPDVPIHDDVLTAVEWWQSQERPRVDVVSGGFPCQPFSGAGARRGSADERWMWPAMADVIRAVRPAGVIVENVAALLRDAAAFGRVLGDLADLGFDAEWSVLSACALGAPHTRERLFALAYAAGELRPARLAQEQRRLRSASLRQGADGEHAWSRPGVWLEAARTADRVADGPTHRLVAAGGNAVVPAVGEVAGRRLIAHLSSEVAA